MTGRTAWPCARWTREEPHPAHEWDGPINDAWWCPGVSDPDSTQGESERCESRHPERGLLCTLPAGHDTHRHVGDAWTTLDRLDGHVFVRTDDLAEVLAVASGLVTPGTTSDVIDRLNAALTCYQELFAEFAEHRKGGQP